MAERRMFAKTIVTSDAFLDMPPTARCLYFTLGMFADDDGFVNNPKSIMRQSGATLDDMNILIAKKFVITFESGVIVIKHWRIHNYIRGDRKHKSKYSEELTLLNTDENGAYTLAEEVVEEREKICQSNDGQVADKCHTEVRLGKDSIGKDSIGKDSKRFIPPTIEEVEEYINEKGYNIRASKFVDYYTSNGWKVGKNPMKDWRAAVRSWAHNNYQSDSIKQSNKDKWDEMIKGALFK